MRAFWYFFFFFFNITRRVYRQQTTVENIFGQKDFEKRSTASRLTDVTSPGHLYQSIPFQVCNFERFSDDIHHYLKSTSVSRVSFVTYVFVCSSQLVGKRSQIVRLLSGFYPPFVRQLVWNEHDRSLEKCHIRDLFIYFSKSPSRKISRKITKFFFKIFLVVF